MSRGGRIIPRIQREGRGVGYLDHQSPELSGLRQRNVFFLFKAECGEGQGSLRDGEARPMSGSLYHAFPGHSPPGRTESVGHPHAGGCGRGRVAQAEGMRGGG